MYLLQEIPPNFLEIFPSNLNFQMFCFQGFQGPKFGPEKVFLFGLPVSLSGRIQNFFLPIFLLTQSPQFLGGFPGGDLGMALGEKMEKKEGKIREKLGEIRGN